MGLFSSLPKDLTNALTALVKAAKALCEAKTNDILRGGHEDNVTKSDLKQTENNIMAKVSETVARILASEAKQDKVLAEVEKLRKDFDKLKDTVSDAEMPAAATAALDRMDARFEKLDALNEDEAT